MLPVPLCWELFAIGGWKLPDYFKSHSKKIFFNAGCTHKEEGAVGEAGITVIKAAMSITIAAASTKGEKIFVQWTVALPSSKVERNVSFGITSFSVKCQGMTMKYARTFCQSPREQFYFVQAIWVKDLRWLTGARGKECEV